VLLAFFSSYLLTFHVFCHHFLKLSNFFFLYSFHLAKYSVFGYHSVRLLSKFSFWAWRYNTLFSFRNCAPKLLRVWLGNGNFLVG